MKNKIIISAALAMMLTITSVFAEAANLNDSTATLTSDGKGVVVSGKVDSAVDEIVIKLMDEGQDGVDSVVKAVVTVDMYKKTEFEKTLKMENELDSGRYYIYISGNGLETPQQPLEIWYHNEIDKDNLIQEIYDSAHGAPGATLINHKNVLFGDVDEYRDDKFYDRADKLGLKNSLYKESYDEDISKILFNKRTLEFDTLKSNLNIATAIAAFEAGEFGYWVNSDGVMTTKIWNDNDPVMGNTQRHFNETLSSVGRQNVIDLLSGEEYATMEEFNKAFARAVIYNGIYYAKSSLIGYGHYATLISDASGASQHDFTAYIELNSTDKSEVGNQLYQAKAGNFDLMVQALNTIINGLGGSNTENTYTGGGGGGGNPTIGANVGGYIPNVPLAPADTSTFSDIDNVEWAKEAIVALKEKGIVSGTGDGKFEPNRAVKREEFIKMLVSALEIEVGQGKESFSDVDANAWYAPFVTKAFEIKITSGMSDGTFGVGRPITREQCCAFIYRACSNRSFDGEEKTFNDSSDVSDYAKESVKALSSAGIIVGDENGNFNPKDNVTRAQTAVMIYRLISGGEA